MWREFNTAPGRVIDGRRIASVAAIASAMSPLFGIR